MNTILRSCLAAAVALLSFSAVCSERIDDLFNAKAGKVFANSASDTAVSGGVTKRRLGSLYRNDFVVTDVTGGGGGGCDTGTVINIVTEYDARVVEPREAESVLKGTSAVNPKRLGAYTWEITTEWEDFDAATNRLSHVFPSYGRCTGVCYGRYQGRNLDWNYDRGATVIVRAPARDGKRGVIGVSSGVVTDAMLSSNKWCDAYTCLPFELSDGMNDSGVVIQQNVLTKTNDTSTWSVDWHKKRSGCIIAFAVIRYVLDRCTNALDAANMIKEITFIPSEFAYDFHFMVSDRRTSYIVEDGDVYSTYDVRTDVMTNFRIGRTSTHLDGTVDWSTVEPYGIGLERYDLAMTNKVDKSTLSGMLETMRGLWYTKAYDTKTTPYWYTEHCSPDTPELTVDAAMNRKYLFHDQIKEWYSDYTNEHDMASANYRGGKTWQTVHTAIYDKQSLHLYLITQEDTDTLSFFTLLPRSAYTAIHMAELEDISSSNLKATSNLYRTVYSYIPYFTDYATNNYKSARLANYRARRLEFWQESVSNNISKLVVNEYTPWVVSTNGSGSASDPAVAHGAYVNYDNYRYTFFLPDGTTSVVEGVEGKTSVSSLHVSNDVLKAYIDMYAVRGITGSHNDLGLATTNDIPRFEGTYDFANGSNFTYHLYMALTNVIRVLGGSVTNAPKFN